MAETAIALKWEEQGIVPMQQKLANFVQQLQMQLEINRDGIPLQYVDPTVIAECVPYAQSLDDIPEDRYRNAITKVDFEDGLPIVNGLPFWERLDGELIEYYKIFKEYRDMRYLQSSQNTGDYKDTLIGTRSLARLSEMIGVPGRLLGILSKIYHWSPRVKAFDRWKEREISIKRQQVAQELECKHAKYANEMLESAISYLKNNPGKMDPKVAVQMVELGMKYGRISVGLLGDKPGNSATAVHQTNIAIQQSTTHNTADNMLNINDGFGNGDDNQGQVSERSAVERQLSDKMKSPETLISVLHVLNKSGALKNAVKTATEVDETEYDGKIDEGDDISDILAKGDIEISDVNDQAVGGE